MGINQTEIEIKSRMIGFASVPMFSPTKTEVDTMSTKTPKNSNKTGKSKVYVKLKNLIL